MGKKHKISRTDLRIINRLIVIFQHSSVDEIALLKRALEVIKQATDVNRLSLLLYSEKSKTINFYLVSEYTIFREGDVSINVFDENNDFYAKLIYSSKRFHFVDNETSVYIPLKRNSEFIGVIWAANDPESPPISMPVVQRLVRYGAVIANGIYRNRIARNQEYNLKKLETIAAISTALISTLQLETLLEIILRGIVDNLEYDRVKLFLIDHDNMLLRGMFRYDLYGTFQSIKDELHPLIIEKGVVINILEEQKKHIVPFNPDIDYFIKYMPMKVRDEIIGFIEINNVFSQIPIDNDQSQYLETFINQASMAIENARLYQKIEEFSQRDSLTTLYNRRFFYQELEKELIRASRYKSNLTLLMIDVDYFKTYNDLYGHLIGDKILKDIAEIIMRSIRKSDIAARFGGDEFIVLLINTTYEPAENIAERIKQDVDDYKITHEQKPLNITISMGVASTDNRKLSPEDFIDLADKALYSAKQSGRNKICYLSDSE